jgi:hypothetical protein
MADANTNSSAAPVARPKVYHLGAALQQIADEHAEHLTPRQREALYQASSKLWLDEAASVVEAPASGAEAEDWRARVQELEDEIDIRDARITQLQSLIVACEGAPDQPKVQRECVCGHRWLTYDATDQPCPSCNPSPSLAKPASEPAGGVDAADLIGLRARCEGRRKLGISDGETEGDGEEMATLTVPLLMLERALAAPPASEAVIASLKEPVFSGDDVDLLNNEWWCAGFEAGKAAAEAQVATLTAERDAALIEIEAAKLFGTGGFFWEKVSERTRDIYRADARAARASLASQQEG